MNYRVVKRAWYRKDSGEMIYRYYVEQEGLTFWRKRKKWYPVGTTHSYDSGSYFEAAVFDTEETAIEYVENLKKGIEDDQVVYPKEKIDSIVVVEAPGDMCGNTRKLPDGTKCPGCRACC